jgi:hypothetical protein
MRKTKSSTDFVRRCLALAAVLGASVAVMGAQTVSQTGTGVEAAQPLKVQTPALDTSSDALFSSSSAENDAAGAGSGTQNLASVNPVPVNFAEAMQYGGGRRRYGSPRYRGGNTNPDGSSKWIFYGGAGFTQPLGNTYKYLTPGYGIQIGGGRQFSKHFAVPIEFDYDHFGLTRQNISDQSCIYTYGGPTSPCDPNAADNGIDANSHVWSFSLDPTYTLYSGEGLGAYVVAGVGFYHKVANFTAPQQEELCYYYCEVGDVQANFDHYTSNAPGFNGGFGLTYKFSHFSNERLYGEIRYVFVDNSQRTGVTINNYQTLYYTYTGANFYPANSNRTTYIPVKFGIRF